MSIARFYYDPFTDFDRLFEDAFSARFPPATAALTRAVTDTGPTVVRPKMDLHENDKDNTVTATFELPGLKKEDVSIDVQNDRLTISGELRQSSERDEAGYVVRERQHGKFSRVIQLPRGTKSEDVKAHMQHGMLTVTFPKSSAEEAPKRIDIK